MTAVTARSSLESSPYINVYDLINTRSNISDPRDPASNKGRKFVYDADSLHLAIDFSQMPYIIVELPTLDYSRMSADGRTKTITWRQRILVRTARDGAANSRTDQGRTDMLNICDDLTVMFNSLSTRQDFSNLRMKFVNLRKVRTDAITIDQKYVYESEYQLQYSERIQVSA